MAAEGCEFKIIGVPETVDHDDGQTAVWLLAKQKVVTGEIAQHNVVAGDKVAEFGKRRFGLVCQAKLVKVVIEILRRGAVAVQNTALDEARAVIRCNDAGGLWKVAPKFVPQSPMVVLQLSQVEAILIKNDGKPEKG